MATINGTPGNDTITEARNTAGGPLAGPGADTIFGGAGGADSLGGGAGDDVIFSSVGASTIDGGDGADSLIGNSNNDRLTGGLGDDTIDGGDGNDDIDGSPGADNLRGGLGNDTIFGSSNDTLLGDDGDDNFTASSGVFADGGAGNDRMFALGFFPNTGASTLVGGEGDDTLRGGNYLNLTADGGDGNDRFEISSGPSADSIIGGGGADTVIYDGSGFSLFANLVTGTVTSSFGSVDTLIGIEALSTGPQADTVQGGAGNESLFGWLGADTLLGGEGSDTLGGGSGNDSLDGESGIDVASFSGNRSNYTVAAIGGGAFSVLGPDGSDTVAGVEALHFTDQSLWLAATSAADSIVGTSSGDTISGLDGNDTIAGDGGPDSIVADAGDDSVLGGDGQDTLAGGGGADTLTGGAEADLFQIAQPFGGPRSTLASMTVVADFAPSQGDRFTFGGEGRANFELLVNAGTLPAQASLSQGQVLPEVNGAGSPRQFFWIPDTAGGAGWGIVDWDDDLVLDSTDSVFRLVFADGTSPASFQPGWAALGDFAVVGTEDNDTITAGPQDLWLDADGLGGDDSITGGSLGEAVSFGLYGRDGNDTVQGGDSENYITGDAGADSLSGGRFHDEIWGGSNSAGSPDGADTLLGNEGDDNLYGEQGDDRLEGGAGNDILSGENDIPTTIGGADTLIGGAGNDRLWGGPGSDEAVFSGNRSNYSISAGGSLLFVSDLRPGSPDGRDTLEGVEWLRFADTVTSAGGQQPPSGGATNGPDSLLGTSANESINGLGGNDTIDGAAGADTLLGGDGDDLLILGPGDFGEGGAGTDVATATHLSFVTTFMSVGSFSPAEGTFSRILLGTGADIVQVGDTTETVQLAGGNFRSLVGTTGADSIAGLPGALNALKGGDGADTIVGTALRDLISGGAGADSLAGAGGNDVILAGRPSGDSIDGGDGYDQVLVGFSGGSGNVITITPTTITSNVGDALSMVNVESAHLYVFASASTVAGSTLDEYVYGSVGADSLVGSAGDDTLLGLESNDTIVGGAGNDSLHGDQSFVTVPGANDLLDYSNAPSSVFVNVPAGAAPIDGFGGADRIAGFERFQATGGSDTMIGSPTNEFFIPFGGADSVDGGGGFDWIIYDFGVNLAAAPVAGINANLVSGIIADGNGSTDSIAGIEAVKGTNFADTIIGDGNANRIMGKAGNDSLDGAGGNDALDYTEATGGILVDLLSGTAEDGTGGTDSIAGFETVIGGLHGDTILGSDGAESLSGDAGADSLVGRGGNDRLFGGLGADTIEGGAGDDLIRPFDGDDVAFGGPGFDTGSYAGDAGPIVATVSAGTDGQTVLASNPGGADTLYGIEAFEASSFADSITIASASSAGLQVRAGLGADTISSAVTDRSIFILADYNVPGVTQGAHVDLQAERAFNDGTGVQDVLIGIANVRGTLFADTLLGTDLNDRFRGRGGNDSMDGRGGTGDVLDYGQASSAGIVADLVAGIVQDGEGGTDTVANFEDIYGTSFADSILGSDVAEVFRPFGGADTVDGGGGQDRISYITQSTGNVTPPSVPVPVHVDLVAGTAIDPWGFTDVVLNIERVTGTSLADTIIGGAAGNRFNGRGGDDLLDGGLGGDFAEYGNATSGVVVDLTAGTAQDGEGGEDTLVSIENVIGSSHADTLTGVAQLGRSLSDLRGGAGDDLLIGIPGEYIRADYADQITGMFVDLGAGTVLDRFGDTDTLVDIRGVVMFGQHADTLLGTAEDEWFSPSEGADSVDGGGGFDIIGYGGLDVGGVVVNLVTQRATDTGGDTDTIIGFEAVAVSFGDDTVLGNAGDNLISPSAGADSVDAGLGQDTISYSHAFSPDGVEFNANELGDRLLVQGVTLDLAAGSATDFAGDEDTILGVEHAIGSVANDTLRGSDSGNRLSGAEGNDVLEGRAGDDTLAGGAGNDSLDGGTGLNSAVFDGSAADFEIVELAGGRLQVTDLRDDAPEGADTLLGIAFLEFADTVVATDGPTAGDDSLEGTAAADTIDALDGNDSVLGLSGVDRLLGGAGNDTLSGGADNDTLLGGNGNDSLDGGPGADSMLGGAGNDSYIVDDPGDRIAETRTGGADTVHSSISWTLGAHQEDLVLLGDAAIDGTGNNLNNVITGNGAANTLLGGGRADTLIGGGGNDLYLIDATDVLIEQAGGGNDTVVANATFALPDHIEVLRFNGTANVRGDGNAEDNFMLGNVANNRLLGYDGNDTLNGGLGNDTLQGGEGADSLVGGDGADRLDGGNGNDTYVLVDADQVIELANAGIDTVLSNISYTLPNAVENLTLLGSADLSGTGNALDNVLTGNGGANVLRGLGGHDRLSGGQAGDTLEGGLGADTLTGSGGFDLFLWLSPSEGGDTLVDFRPGDDKLAFAAGGFGGLEVGPLNAANFAINAPSAAVPQFVYREAQGVLEWDATGTGIGPAVIVVIATLANKPKLSATDFEIVA